MHTHTHAHMLAGDSQSDSSLSVTVSGGAGSQPHPSRDLQPSQHQPQNPNSVTYINPLHRSPNFEPQQPQAARGDGAQMNGHSQQQYPGQPQMGRQPPLLGYAPRYPPPPYNYNHQYVHNDRAGSEPGHGPR